MDHRASVHRHGDIMSALVVLLVTAVAMLGLIAGIFAFDPRPHRLLLREVITEGRWQRGTP